MTTNPSFRPPHAVWRVLCAAALMAVALAVSCGTANAEVGNTGPGTLNLTFVDTAGDPAMGACVEIWKGDYEVKAAEFCNTSGSSVRQLPVGSYVIYETQPPNTPHVFRKAEEKRFEILSALTTNVVLRHERGAIVDAAALLPDGAGAAACFTARPLGIGTVGPVQDQACSTGGSARLYVGAPTTIVISQESGPSGYALAPDVHVQTVLGGQHTATLQMRAATGSIAIEQQDANGAVIKGGCYSVYEAPTGGSETFFDYVCDRDDDEVDGVVHARDLQPKRYRVVEEVAPAGFKVNATSTFVTVGSSEERVVRTHEPLPGVHVKTTAGGAPLAGSCWRVYTPGQHEGWLAEVCDSADGKADGTTNFTTLEPGSYELFHLSAPAGYVEVDGYTPFVLGESDVTLTFALGGVVAPVNTKLPTVTGDPRSGTKLGSTRGTWTGTEPMTFSLVWQRCDAAGDGCAPVASGAEYTPVPADVGHALRMVVTAKNDGGTKSAASAPTAPIVAGEPINTVEPSVTGLVTVGRTLTGKAGTWINDPTQFDYQWLRCNNVGAGCAPIAGALGLTYVLTLADVGSSLRLSVAATNAAGTTVARSLPTAVLKAYPPVNETPPSLLVLLRSIASGTTGTWVSGYGEISYAFQWLRCDSVGEGCAPIQGATAAAYLVPASDTQFRLRLQVFATNTNGTSTAISAASELLGPRPPVNTKLPRVKGDLGVQRKLSADRGDWTSVAGKISYAYQWLRCDAAGDACEPIEGATKDDYKPVFEDGNGRLRVRVIATNAEGSSEVDSPPTGVIPLYPAVNQIPPSVDGDLYVGQELSTNLGRWDWEGPTMISFDKQWQRCANIIVEHCTDIPGATAQRYRLTLDDAGYRIRVLVWGDNEQGVTLAISHQTPVLELHPPVNQIVPSVDGDLYVGQELSTNLGRWAWEGPSFIHFDKQWQRCANLIVEHCTDIPGATFQKYRLTLDDAGYRIRVLVWGDNGEGRTLAISNQTAILELHPPVNEIRPSLDGTVMVGDELSTNLGRWNWEGPSFIHFDKQWQRCTNTVAPVCSDIPGATAQKYRPTIVDGGYRFRVLVWGDNGEGRTLAVSDISAVLVLYPPVNQILPSVDGTLTVGEELSTNLGRWDWEGKTMISFDKQWQRCSNTIAPVCTAIPGATHQKYVLTADDLGYRIRVQVWGDNEQGVTLAESNLTAVLTLHPPVNEIRPSIDGSLQVGKTLSTNLGRWRYEGRTVTFVKQWQRCEPTGGCVAIPGATKQEYKLTAEDRGKRMLVAVWADNGQGSTLAESFLSGVVQ